MHRSIRLSAIVSSLLGLALAVQAADVTTTVSFRSSEMKLTIPQNPTVRRAGQEWRVAWIDGAVGVAGERVLIGNRVVLACNPGVDPQVIATQAGVNFLGETLFPGTYYLSGGDSLTLSTRLASLPGVKFCEPDLVFERATLGTPNDPLLNQQWHLANTGQAGGGVGEDINVTPAWASATGKGVVIAIHDSGMELTHEDLKDNIRTDLQYDFADHDSDASADPTEAHATFCAGCAAGRGNNGLGGAGVAYEASIAPVRLGNTETDIAAGFVWKSDVISVQNNSWGFTGSLGFLGQVLEAGLKNGVTTGRAGKGMVYLFAAGNSRREGDNADYGGFPANRYVLAVGASNHLGKQSAYSESGACLFVNAPGGDRAAGDGIVSADRNGVYDPSKETGGYSPGSYTSNSDYAAGTSFASPIAAGVVALMLQVNPGLSWRDVRFVLAQSSFKNDPSDASWLSNGANLHWSYRYGFGRVDAAAAVARAKTWSPVAAESTPIILSQATAGDVAIPDNGIASTSFSATGTFAIETVELKVDLVHPKRGQIQYVIKSPVGTKVTILARPTYDLGADLKWTFSTPAFLGESITGDWTVELTDTVAGESGVLKSAQLTFYGIGSAGGGTGNGGNGGVGSGVNGEASNNNGGAGAEHPGPTYDGASNDSGGCGLGTGMGLVLSGCLLFLLRFRRS